MAHNDEVRMYNSYGEEYEVPRERVYSIDRLQRGDHIAFHQYGAYWHHAIVEYIDSKRREIHVIEYSNTATGFLRDNSSSPKNPGMAQVVRGTCRFDEVTVYLLIHERCLDPDSVVRRARRELREGRKNWNPFTNNCEHFAMRCKTGRSSSDQVNKLAQKVRKENTRQTMVQTAQATRSSVKGGSRMTKVVVSRAASQAGRGFVRSGTRETTQRVLSQSATQAGRQFVRTGSRMATQRVLTQTATQGGRVLARTGTEMATNVVAAQTASQAGRVVMRTGMSQSLSQAGQEAAAASLAGSAGVGGALVASIEGMSMIYDISRAHDSMMEGSISEGEFTRTVAKRVTTGTGNIGGSIAGAVIGQAVIPVPILGGLLGGVLGGLAGSFLGNIYGNVVFD